MVMRRRRAWGDTRFAGFLLAASGTDKKDLLVGLTAADTKTVTRLIVDLWAMVPSGNSLSLDRENVVDMGIGVASREAFDLETLPDPGTVTDYPQLGWLYVNSLPCYKSGDGLGALNIVHAHFKVDLRAQRKVDRGVLFMLIENIGVVGADAVALYGRVRALCLT